MGDLKVIKVGGNVIDDPEQLSQFLKDFSQLKDRKILVHGGGKLANKLASDLGHEAKMVEGRRITDEKTLDIVSMTYAGLVNKNIVAKLQAIACNALGLSGADGNTIKAIKRPVRDIDYGFVGDVSSESVNVELLDKFLSIGVVPVFSAITHNGDGQLLNTNADTIASVLAVALSKVYDCSLVYCFEKKGVLKDIDDDNSVLTQIKSSEFKNLQDQGIISDGMIPKIHNSFDAIKEGVKEVLIGSSRELSLLEERAFGTRLIK